LTNWRNILILAGALLLPILVRQTCLAQGTDQTYVLPPGAAPAMDPHDIADKIANLSPKTVVFVFDVTMSTSTGGVFEREREATATILRHGCKQGDHVVLIKFGTGISTVFDTTLSESVSADSLIDKIPPAVEPGAGTNIRWPHNAALRLIEADRPNPGVVVLLTDSFNDQPLKTDPNYPMYRAYYNLYKLTVYPKTPQNRDYEGLLRELYRQHRLHEYGVGVAIARSGRPVERLPNGPGESDSPDASDNTTPTVLTQQGHETQQTNWPAILGGAAAALLLLIVGVGAALGRPASVRLSLGGKSVPVDFRLKPGARLSLGGSPATAPPGVETYAIPGLKEAAAYIVGQRGGSAAIKSANADGIRVLHNGVSVSGEMPIRVDDEVRIIVAATDGAEERQIRVRVLDPKAPH